MGHSQSKSKDNTTPKKSLHQRFEDKKGSKPLTDEQIKQATGKSRDELNDWADKQPGVGRNQLSGGMNQGPAGGFTMVQGLQHGDAGKDRGMKFPPAREE